MKLKRTVARLLVSTALLAFVLFAGFPVYWMLNTALTSDTELYKSGQDWWPHAERLPGVPDALADVPIGDWLLNSGFIAFGTTMLSLLLAVLGAYALSRYRFHGKGAAAFLLFSTQMLPEALLVVPLFALFGMLGLLNGLGGLVLANTAFAMPVALFIVKSAIDKIPYEIEESARVDGCPRYGQLTQIVLPLVTPSIAAAAVVTFFDGWNEFLFANTFLTDSEKWPASVGLATFVGQYTTPLSSVMAAAFLFSLPAIVFFVLMQRRIVSGLTAGAVKG
ncbi:carbohydrate ABC transporter permease [Glycomyces harbinensis]|uniref:Multiple sugar transport system permease protein n=1 Tax=Glycomyces harbinensis TaxID=58114 RepID=A0A1G6UA56_9ACTN|nr:carbohydrate ABC transporter permease [Glycomyces harbinensis]SDD38272.1 multiple sugar transport system permease protein [Glycomyces harbinensis]